MHFIKKLHVKQLVGLDFVRIFPPRTLIPPRGRLLGILEYVTNITRMIFQIVAHEIGHNLNMDHDFDPSPGNKRLCDVDGSTCTDIGGVMDYFGVMSLEKKLQRSTRECFDTICT